MSREKIAKRQKVSHGSTKPSAPSESEEREVEELLPSSSDAEESDNEQPDVEVEEEAPKTFKDLVSDLALLVA